MVLEPVQGLAHDASGRAHVREGAACGTGRLSAQLATILFAAGSSHRADRHVAQQIIVKSVAWTHVGSCQCIGVLSVYTAAIAHQTVNAVNVIVAQKDEQCATQQSCRFCGLRLALVGMCAIQVRNT